MDKKVGPSGKRSIFLPVSTIVLFAAVTAVQFFYPQVSSAYFYLTDRASICTLPEALRTNSETRAQVLRKAEFEKSSRVIQTAADGTELWSTPRGDWWTPQGSGGAMLYDLSEQDRDIYWSHSEIRPGDVVLDCGANIGLFTKKALAAGASHVIAIEPAPENLAALKRNLAHEIADGRVTVYEKGVWDKEDVLTMYRDPKNSAENSFVFDRGAGTDEIQLPLTTIDLLVAELGLKRVDFIKLDIEGSERQAIAGASETIRHFRPRIALCLYHRPEDAKTLPAAVLAVNPGYEFACGCIRARDSIFAQVGHFRPR